MSEDLTASRYPFEPLQYERLEVDEALRRAQDFLVSMRGRRSVRAFSAELVPFELIENAIATAMTAPSGANQQPWKFVVVQDRQLKQRMRELVNEKPFVVLPMGYPAENCRVPALRKKQLDEVIIVR